MGREVGRMGHDKWRGIAEKDMEKRVTSYAEASELLYSGNDMSGSREVADFTWIEERPDGAIAIEFHTVDVVTYRPDGIITLSSGGYKTLTTQRRLNQFSPFEIYSEGKQRWAVWSKKDSAKFRDGIWCAPNGTFQIFKQATYALWKSRDRNEYDAVTG